MNVGLNELADLFKGSQLKKSLKKQGVLGFFYIKVCACWPNEHCDMKTALALIFDGKRCSGTQRR